MPAKPLEHRPEAADRILSGARISGRQSAGEKLVQSPLECGPLGREAHQSLSAIPIPHPRLGKPARDEFGQHAAERLFGDAEKAQQLGHGEIRVPRDKVKCALVRSAKAGFAQRGIDGAHEPRIAKEQQLDSLPDLGLGQEQRRRARRALNTLHCPALHRVNGKERE